MSLNVRVAANKGSSWPVILVLLIIQAVELICQTNRDAAVFEMHHNRTSLQKRFIVVLNSIFVGVTEN